MSNILEKIQQMGLDFPPVPKPQGAYVPAVQSGSWVFVAGQLPMVHGTLKWTGRLGKELSIEEGQEAARICFLNTLAAACSLGFSLDQIERIVQLTGFVQCTDTFFDQPKVLNGASLLAHEIFGAKGIHARMAVGAQALPLNAPVEIAAIFEVSGIRL
jgi:enamine deaminase RidA (YjgF/YER057c/UK114 family)